MKSELLATSPLLALPLFAFILFLAVFMTVVFTTYARNRKSYEPIERLPLDDGDDR